MIATQRKQLGLLGDGARCLPPAELLQGLGHLLAGNVVIDGGDGDVAAVHHLSPVLVGVDAGAGVEAPERRLAGRGLADGTGPEARARAVAHSRVEGDADDGDVEGLGRLSETLDVVKVGKGANSVKGPLRCVRVDETSHDDKAERRNSPRNPISGRARPIPLVSIPYRRDRGCRLRTGQPRPRGSGEPRTS